MNEKELRRFCIARQNEYRKQGKSSQWLARYAKKLFNPRNEKGKSYAKL